MAVLLTYRLAPARQAAVRMICARLKIRARAVESVEYGCRVAPVALKAVLTETNAGWDSVRLHEELCRERDALSRGGKAHRE